MQKVSDKMLADTGTMPAWDGSALTSLAAGNMTAGGAFPAIDGSALTGISTGNVATHASSAYKNANQSFTHNAWTKISFEIENYDVANNYDTSTNEFTVPSGADGKYLVTANIQFQSADTRPYDCAIYINGSKKKWNSHAAGVTNYGHGVPVSDVVDLSAGDTVCIYGRGYNIGQTITIYGGSGHYRNWFSVTRLT